jgi:T5SS/PEP-CTERM-associated repeat protein
MRLNVAVLACLFFTLLTCSCLAADYFWDDSGGGSFGESDNWNPVGVPGLGDAALFTLPAAYTVTLDEPRFNSMFDVDGSDVTLNLNGYEYFIEYASETGDRAATIGDYGNGSLRVSNGYIYSKEVSIGQFGDASGSLTVSDPNTLWTAWQDDSWYGVWIGEEGNAHLSVLNNAMFRHGHGVSAFGSGSDTLIDVNGIDSEWYVDGYFGMSVFGKTTVNITNGGRARFNVLEMATQRGSSAQINITGQSHESELAMESGSENSLVLGSGGQGTIYVKGSKIFNAGNMIIGQNTGSSGLLDIHEGSWVDCLGSVAIGGTLTASGGVGQLSIIDDVPGNETGVQFTPTSAEGQSVVVWPQGTITMDGGEIETIYDAQLANPIILRGGTLEGNGMIWAHVENRGGIVAPNDDLDQKVLEIGRNYTQDATGTLKIVIAGQNPVSQYSHLRVIDPNYGQVSLDGMLDVDLIDGFVPNYNDEFTIIAAQNITGTFSNAPSKYVSKDYSFDVIYNTDSYDSVILTHYSTEPTCPKYPLADINKDCTVDLTDFAILATQWLECNLVPDSYCFGGPVVR